MPWIDNGYIRTRVDGKLVFEHKLVMEKKLGRKLLPGESVHHRDGNRSNNHPDNLELWVRPQPTGARHQDAVEWAKNLLLSAGFKVLDPT